MILYRTTEESGRITACNIYRSYIHSLILLLYSDQGHDRSPGKPSNIGYKAREFTVDSMPVDHRERRINLFTPSQTNPPTNMVLAVEPRKKTDTKSADGKPGTGLNQEP